MYDAHESNRLEDLVDNFEAACDAVTDAITLGKSENIRFLLSTILPMLRLRNVACLRFERNRSDDVTLLAALVTYSKEWQVRYFSKRYHEIDPVVVIGVKASHPFDWGGFQDLSPEVSTFFRDAADHGVGNNGVTIPVRSSENCFALVSFSSNMSKREWSIYKDMYMSRLRTLSCLLFVASGRNMKLASRTVGLSKREQQALIWAARGKKVAETAVVMGISYSSVRTYIESARAKLGCENVTHAVASAVATGVIPAQALRGEDPTGYTGLPEVEEALA